MSNDAFVRWTAEEDARLEELAAAGHSDAEIAERIGRTEDSVFRRRRTKRICLNRDKKKPKVWTAEEIAQMNELHSTGKYTIAELAKRFNSSISNVQRRLKYRELNCLWTDERIEQCVELRRKGLTYTQIAKITGVSASAVSNMLIRNHPELCRKNSGSTLCWDCQNARAGGCSWFTDFTPVPGWEAEETMLEFATSYKVNECPNFIRDEERSCAWLKST